MTIPTPDFSARSYVKRGALLSALFLTTFLLASCGGESDTAQTSSANSADERKQAQAVPGTWTGRAPKYEVINGITVPPEPAPSINNATLAGVDINNNGVRDDVERKIARNYPSAFSHAMEIATSIGKIFYSQSNGELIAKEIDCAQKRTKFAGGKVIFDYFNNTEARKDALIVWHYSKDDLVREVSLESYVEGVTCQ
jgi:hypothetical protein